VRPRRAIGFVRRVCASPSIQHGAYCRKSDWQAADAARTEIGFVRQLSRGHLKSAHSLQINIGFVRRIRVSARRLSLPTSYCLLPIANCLLSAAFGFVRRISTSPWIPAQFLLPAAYCLLPTAYWLLPSLSHILTVGRTMGSASPKSWVLRGCERSNSIQEFGKDEGIWMRGWISQERTSWLATRS
jgi:hypothetical protein